MKFLPILCLCLCLAVFAGCGDHIQKIDAQQEYIQALERERDAWKELAESSKKSLDLAEEARDENRKSLDLARTFGKQRDEAEARYAELASACIIQWEAQDQAKEQSQHDEWTGRPQEKWLPLNIDFTPRPRYVVEPKWNPVPPQEVPHHEQ